MKTKITKLIQFAVVLFFTLSNSTAFSQVIQSEGFNSAIFLPTGWSAAPVGSSTNSWTRSTAGTFPTCAPHSGAGMARYNSRVSTAGSMQTIATPAFDNSQLGANVSHISLWIFRNDTLPAAYDTLNVMVNTTADTTGAITIGTIARSRQLAIPDTQATNGWYQYIFTIPSTFNTATNYLLFRGVTQSGGNTGYRIFIDDIAWETYPALCSGTPTAGTITAGTSLICGGSGSTNLILNGATTGFAGINYQWQSASVSGGPYTNFGTSVMVINSGTLTSTTYFRCKVTCTASNDSVFTPEITVRVNPNAAPVVNVTPASATYCTNSGVTPMLIASGAATYTWAPAQGLSSTTTDTVFASPTNSTTYLVTGYDTFGCFDTATVRVSVQGTPTVTATPTNVTSCLGDSISLSAASTGIGGGGTTVNYLWSPGGLTGATVKVPVDSSITYYVTGTTNLGCSGPQSTDTVVITALSIPNAGTISAADTVLCGGAVTTQLQLLNATSGSTISYSWEFSSSATGPWTVDTTGVTSITTDTLTARTYYRCVVTCGGSSSSTTPVISINLNPNLAPVVTVSPNANHCAGSTPVILVAGGATSYSWSPATGLSSTTNDTVYASPTASTTYIVTGYDSFGCRDTASVRVSNRQIPNVTVNTLAATICEGDSITLTANASVLPPNTTVTYTWMPGALTGATITVAPIVPVDYIVTGVTNFGCTADISVDTAMISVNQLTHSSFTYTQTLGSFTFTSTSSNAISYMWHFSPNDSSTSANPTFVYPMDGMYPVILIATGLCNSDTIIDTLNVIFDGINQLDGTEFSMSPNPAKDFIKVDLKLKADRVEVVDVQGRVVVAKKVENVASSNVTFDVRELTNGIYFIRVINGSTTRTNKFIKE